MNVEKQENLATPGPTRAAHGLRVADRGTSWSMGLPGSRDTQRQLDDLSARLTQNHDDIAAQQETATQARRHPCLSEGRADETGRRLDQLEARCDENRTMITELQAEALISRQQAATLEAALRTSRMIGAAVGIVMAFYGVTESGGFEILKKASQDSNRKLRVLAEEVVMTGGVTKLPRP